MHLIMEGVGGNKGGGKVPVQGGVAARPSYEWSPADARKDRSDGASQAPMSAQVTVDVVEAVAVEVSMRPEGGAPDAASVADQRRREEEDGVGEMTEARDDEVLNLAGQFEPLMDQEDVNVEEQSWFELWQKGILADAQIQGRFGIDGLHRFYVAKAEAVVGANSQHLFVANGCIADGLCDVEPRGTQEWNYSK